MGRRHPLKRLFLPRGGAAALPPLFAKTVPVDQTETVMRLLATTATLAFFAAAAIAGAEDRVETGSICPTVWKPVCAAKGSERRTFPNACSARSAGWSVAKQGRCEDGTALRPGLCFGKDCPKVSAEAQ